MGSPKPLYEPTWQSLRRHATPQDIRFTQKGSTLYAICLGWPGDTLTVRALGSRGKLGVGDIESVGMLGVDGELRWKQTDTGLTVEMPAAPPCSHAVTLRIERSSGGMWDAE